MTSNLGYTLQLLLFLTGLPETPILDLEIVDKIQFTKPVSYLRRRNSN